MTYSFAIIITYLESTFLALRPSAVIFWSAAFLFSTYILTATFVYLLSKVVNRPFEAAPIHTGQILHEINESIRTILIFSIAWVIPWALLQLEIVTFAHHLSLQSIALESMLLILWHDIHFYVVHRFVHAKLSTSNDTHHVYSTVTPYSAYNLGVKESILLSTALPIAMLFGNFSILSIMIMIVCSTGLHVLAHANCNLFPHASEYSLLGFLKHHALHHQHHKGRYSLLITLLDRWFHSDKG